jgi:hypothetical protein
MKQFIKNILKKVYDLPEAIYEALKSPGPPLVLSLLMLLLIDVKVIYNALGEDFVTLEWKALALDALMMPLLILNFWAIVAWQYHKQKKDKPNE